MSDVWPNWVDPSGQPGQSVWINGARVAIGDALAAIPWAANTAFKGMSGGADVGQSVKMLNSPSAPATAGNATSQQNFAIDFGSPGATPAGGTAPSPSDPVAARAGPTPGLVTMKTPTGGSYTVNQNYAANFAGFLNDLAATGYKVNSVQGYNARDIAGTKVPSYHGQGAAIDINPGDNAEGSAGDLPANVGALAQKWGLGWGGNWKSKKDPMHFSIAAEEGGSVPLTHTGLGSGFVTVNPAQAPGSDPYTVGPQISVDPAAAMAMISPAQMLQHVSLPAAPQEELPANLTAPTLIDPTSFLAPLKAAEAVKPLDTSHFANDRLTSMLAAAASAAGSMAAPRVGQLLASAGGAAGTAFEGTKKEQQQEQDKYDGMVRDANISLAQAGMNVTLQNLATTNNFTQRQDTRADEVRTTKYANATEAFQDKLKQIGLNLGIDEGNANRQAQVGASKASVGIAALDNNASTQNAATNAQTELNIHKLDAGASGVAMTNTTGQILDNVGIPRMAQQGKDDPLNDNAREAAQSIASVQVAKADPALAETSILGNLGKEMVMNGSYTSQLDPKTAASVTKILYPNGPQKPPTLASLAQAAGIVTNQLTANKPGAYKIAQFLAQTQNAPVAKLIASRLKKQPVAP